MTACKPRLVILISGSGTNLQAFIDQVQNKTLNAEIAAVISNRPGVLGLERARKANIATAVVDHKAFDGRESFDQELANVIDSYKPDLLILAGFMRILTPGFVRRYQGRMMNIHPSLLPKYPGLNTHQRALDAGDSEHGVTVHFVTEELDGGPPIIQASVPVLSDDNADSLAKRVQQQEHLIYPLAADWFIKQRLDLNNGVVILDDKPLPAHGYRVEG
jgi:phosphoribosylglycinamide formyltransferase-1